MMKLEHTLPFSACLVAGLLCGALLARADAFVYTSAGVGGPRQLVLPRTGSCSQLGVSCYESDFEASPRGRRYRERQQRADEAFRELRRELEDSKKRGRGPRSFRRADKEATKKWVEKAFDLASEFNSDFTATPKDRDANDEFLQKSRKWAEQLLHASADNESATESAATETTTETEDDSPSDKDESRPDDDEPLTETPNLVNTSDEETFRVEVDLPGVERDDVDVTVEDEFLVVRATRQQGTGGQPARKYAKKIAFVESEVDIEKLEASFKNGVLVVSAPKIKKEANEIKRRIPIV